MKKVTLLALLSIGLLACKGSRPSITEDSISFAVFDGVPLDAVEDLEPVYIDLNELKAYRVSDTVEVNEHGFIPAVNSPETGWHEVILDKRLPNNKSFSRNEAEANQ